mmetsp:Transcript_29330/g.58204  ORF Transcript_29330/g.58204 Transcript_29330/m.58204 type:complete len:129 (-) Transcript_29330:143-529(-)
MTWTRPGQKRPDRGVTSPENLTKGSTGELLEDSRAPTPQETVENADLLSRGLFGERMLVEGCPSSKICVGGVYFMRRSPLVVEVTSLRKVCKTMDKNSADRTSRCRSRCTPTLSRRQVASHQTKPQGR